MKNKSFYTKRFKRLMVLACGLFVAIGALFANPCFAKESQSFKIMITIPRIVEQANKPLHPPLPEQEVIIEDESEDKNKTSETDSKKPKPQEGYTVIVRTIFQEP